MYLNGHGDKVPIRNLSIHLTFDIPTQSRYGDLIPLPIMIDSPLYTDISS